MNEVAKNAWHQKNTPRKIWKTITFYAWVGVVVVAMISWPKRFIWLSLLIKSISLVFYLGALGITAYCKVEPYQWFGSTIVTLLSALPTPFAMVQQFSRQKSLKELVSCNQRLSSWWGFLQLFTDSWLSGRSICALWSLWRSWFLWNLQGLCPLYLWSCQLSPLWRPGSLELCLVVSRLVCAFLTANHLACHLKTAPLGNFSPVVFGMARVPSETLAIQMVVGNSAVV